MNNRRVIQTDSLKLPVAPLSPDEYLGGRDASEATEIPRWSTEDWKAVVLGDAVLALPDGTRWSLLEVHHVFVNDRDAEIDGSPRHEQLALPML